MNESSLKLNLDIVAAWVRVKYVSDHICMVNVGYYFITILHQSPQLD